MIILLKSLNVDGWPIQPVNAWHFHPITCTSIDTVSSFFSKPFIAVSSQKHIDFKQAIEALEDVQVFLEHWSYVEQAISVGKVTIDLAGISVYNYTQTTIDQ